ncbi:glutamine-rich protein 2-like [Montipora foliosa]|uniref:glutamine-rich protein 2-like n=1 Tax=Montipora foliosa TaxID=591990 RepID=UPI0035F1BA9D
MATFVELEQLLDIALTTPEVGTVNFNILRVFLQEILKHLNIENKAIEIESLRSELKSAYDFITEGHVEVQSREARSAQPDKSPDNQSPEDEELKKAETPALVVEDTDFEQATEPSPLEPSTEPSPQLQLKDSSPASASRKPGNALSAKDRLLASKSSVVLIRKSDSFGNFKRIVAELQERVEVLESQQSVPEPDHVRSAASLVRKDSKTPAHDFVELINIKRKLEALENAIEGLTDMLDALTSDMNELKEISLKSQDLNGVVSELEGLKSSVKALQDEKVSEKLADVENAMSRLDELGIMISNLVDDVNQIKNQESPSVVTTINDSQECLFKGYEKQFQDLVAQIRKVQEKINETDAKSFGAEQAASDALTGLQAIREGFSDIGDKLTGLKKQMEDHKSMIEDNEMQIHQLKNTISLLQRQSLDRMNVEPKEEEKVIEPVETPRRHSYSHDREELSLIRTMIFDLQEEKDKLKQADIRLSDELFRKQKHLDDIYNLIDELRDVKADKELLSIGFDMKADKREMDCKIGRDDFDHYMSLVDQSLRDLLQRLEGHEDALNATLSSLTSDVGKKLDKEEVEPLKHYLESRMDAMKPKPVEKPPPEELAAGIRKQFLVNHNCISCDRPVKYASEAIFPPLPTMHSMPGSKSNRPYTTFELEQIRQHMLQGGLAITKERFEMMDKQRNKLQKEILRLSGARNLQELAEVTARACGGIHTLTYPHSQAIVRGLQLNRDDFDFLVPQRDFQSVDIRGQDGHIYKGLLDNLPPTLPEIQQKRKFPKMSTAQRNLRRSTTPASANNQKILDPVDSS